MMILQALLLFQPASFSKAAYLPALEEISHPTPVAFITPSPPTSDIIKSTEILKEASVEPWLENDASEAEPVGYISFDGYQHSDDQHTAKHFFTVDQKPYTQYHTLDLPQHGYSYPNGTISEYDQADYDSRFYLSTSKYRRYNPVDNAALGAVSSLDRTVTSMYNVFRHPNETFHNIGFAAKHPVITAKAVEHRIVKNTRDEGLSNTIGGVLFEAGALVSPLAVGKLAYGAAAELSADAGGTAAEMAKTGHIAEEAGEAAVGAGVALEYLEGVSASAEVVHHVAEAREVGDISTGDGEESENEEAEAKAKARHEAKENIKHVVEKLNI